MGRLRFSNADGIVSNAGVIAPLPTTAVGPLLASGGPSLVFALTTLQLLAVAVLMLGIVAALPLVVFTGFELVDACLGLGPLPFRHGSRGARRGSRP